tara:strand:+ start:214 stop:609 length:396 start_codon:yes stop_codon:yes gene_type:complete
MAYTQALVSPVGDRLVKFSQLYPGKGVPLTHTVLSAVAGGKLVAVEIDNTGNGTTDAYLRLWTAVPATLADLNNLDFVFKAPLGAKLQYTLNPPLTLQGVTLCGAFLTTPDLTAVDPAPTHTITANIMLAT